MYKHQKSSQWKNDVMNNRHRENLVSEEEKEFIKKLREEESNNTPFSPKIILRKKKIMEEETMTKFEKVLAAVSAVFLHGATVEDAWDGNENDAYLNEMTALIMETVEG